jgi:hypothetical protein
VLGCNKTGGKLSEFARNSGTNNCKKAKMASRKQGAAWTMGYIVNMTDKEVFVTMSQEKWDKCQAHIG